MARRRKRKKDADLSPGDGEHPSGGEGAWTGASQQTAAQGVPLTGGGQQRVPAGVVLAGGRSRRMGTNKALLRLGNETMLERAVHALEPLASPVVIAGGTADRYTLPGTTCLADPLPDAGPLGGVLAALEASNAPAVLVLACDLPFITSSFMHLLLVTAPDASLVVTRNEATVQPLCGRYATTLRAPLRAYLERGERSVFGFVSSCQHTYLDVGPGHPLYHPSLLSNINVTDDMAHAASEMRRRGNRS